MYQIAQKRGGFMVFKDRDMHRVLNIEGLEGNLSFKEQEEPLKRENCTSIPVFAEVETFKFSIGGRPMAEMNKDLWDSLSFESGCVCFR